jgi:hypothetical protein
MKKIMIYKEGRYFTITRMNEFNHPFKRQYDSLEGFIKGVQAFILAFSGYQIEVSETLVHDLQKVLEVLEYEGLEYEVKSRRDFPN